MRLGPPEPRWPSGPRCGPYVDEEGEPVGECPWRKTSFGYVPPRSPAVTLREEDGTVYESGGTISTPFLFLSKAPGPDEIEHGANMVGPSGRLFSRVLKAVTEIRRESQTVASVVRCRPVQWKADGTPRRRDYNDDHATVDPSPGQVRECARRYTDSLIKRFTGETVAAFGKIALQYMTGQVYSIENVRGNIWEPGENIQCDDCQGEGRVHTRDIKCKACGGRGQSRCPDCRRWAATKKCITHRNDSCDDCDGLGMVPGKKKKCPGCEGAGIRPKDPDKPYVCDRLKSHQLLFATYDPAYIHRQGAERGNKPPLQEIFETDISRLATLREELVDVQNVQYDIYPDAAEWLEQAEILSIDLETSGGLDPAEGDIRCWGATERVRHGAVFGRDDPRLWDALRSRTIVGQNFVLYDWWWLDRKGYEIGPDTRVIDTRYLGKLLNPDTPNDLVYLTGQYASPPIRGYWKTKNDYRDGIEKVCAIDIDATLRVYYGQKAELEAQGRWGIVEDYIIPLSRVVFEMRKGGMKIDQTKMDQTRQELERELLDIRASLPWDDASENQSARIQEFLYVRMGLPEQRSRKTGERTADRGALEELGYRIESGHASVKRLPDGDLALASQTIKALLHARGISKLSSAFLKYKLDGSEYIHPALNMGGSARGKHEPGRGTATWRFSCTDPNAQQVPKSARGLFVPDEPDWEIMSVDLSQAEVVGFLWYAEAWEVLKDVLHRGHDAHQMVADQIGIPRDDAKNTTFAILYGESERTTATRVGKPLKDIKELRERYFEALPGVEEYRLRTVSESQRKGYVESPFGFRRFVVAESTKGRAANMACNMPIQNIPPVVLGRAMIGLHRELPTPSRLLMQVHDELVLTYPAAMRREVLECVVDWMRRPVPELHAAPIGMPGGLIFNLDVAVGPNWGELTDIDWKEELK